MFKKANLALFVSLFILSADALAYNPDPATKWKSWQNGTNAVHTPQLRDGNVYKLSPAEIIYYSAKENNVNPFLLMVKLQHEATLLTEAQSNYQHQLDRSTGFDFTTKQSSSSYSGFYPQLVAASFQFNLWKSRYKTFEEGLTTYSSDKNAPSLIKQLYAQYAPLMNKAAHTNYTSNPVNSQYTEDFKNISINDIQTFLDSLPATRLKDKNLFKDSTLTPNIANLQTWQKQNLQYAQDYYNKYNKSPLTNVFGSTCGQYTYCYKWSRNAPAIGLNGYASAKIAFDSLNSKGIAIRDTNFAHAPIGSMVFYGNGTYGHAAIKVNETEIVSQGQLAAHDCTISKISYNKFGNYMGYYAPSSGATTLADSNVIAFNQRVSRGDFLHAISSILDRFDSSLPKDPIEKAKLMGIVGNPSGFSQTSSTPIIRQDSAQMLINVITYYEKNRRKFNYNGNVNQFLQDNEISSTMKETAKRAAQLELFLGDEDESGIKRFVGQRQLSQYESGIILDRLTKLMQMSQSTLPQPIIQTAGVSSQTHLVGSSYLFSSIISNSDSVDRVVVLFSDAGNTEYPMSRQSNSNTAGWQFTKVMNQAGNNRPFEIRVYKKGGGTVSKTGLYDVQQPQNTLPQPIIQTAGVSSQTHLVGSSYLFSSIISNSDSVDRVVVLFSDAGNTEYPMSRQSNSNTTGWQFTKVMNQAGNNRPFEIRVYKKGGGTVSKTGSYDVQVAQQAIPAISQILNSPHDITRNSEMAFAVKVTNPDSVVKAEVVFTDVSGVSLLLNRQSNGDVWAAKRVLTGIGTNRPYKIVVYNKFGGTVEQVGNYTVR